MIKDNFDLYDDYEREEERMEKLHRTYSDPDTWDRQWDLIKEEQLIESIIRDRN